jgi:(p)ppGpp synthase/HD superfamily hydrolase
VTPEWFHQISICLYLITIAGLEEVIEDLIIITLLHDLVEDYGYSLENLVRDFGPSNTNSIQLLSKKLPGHSDKKSNPNYYADIAEDYLAPLVKAGDRVNNFQTMAGVFSYEKQRSYVQEGRDFFLPMLKRSRTLFPEHHLACENLKLMLLQQITSIENMLKVVDDTQA